MYQNIHIETLDKKTQVGIAYIWDDEKGLITEPYKPYAFKKKNGGKYVSMHGTPLDKTYDFSYKQTDCYETDVPAITRMLIDLYGDSNEISKGHRVLTIDIETGTDGGYALPTDPFQPITAIAIHDDVTGIYQSFILDINAEHSDYDENKSFILNLNKKDVEIPYNKKIRFFKNEKNLIEAFVSEYKKIKPTIITGWNIDGFDLPYIYHRFEKIMGNGYINCFSEIGIVKYIQKKERLYIAGVSSLDYLNLYKKFTFATKRLPNHRLDTVAWEELKLKKLKYDGSLSDLMRNDIKQFIDYNLNDVLLVVLIEKVNKFIDLARGISHVGHISYEDFGVSSRLIEGALLTYLRTQNIVAPNKPDIEESENEFGDDDDEDDKFEGAYVKEPVPGLYDWIFSIDVNSLYPSIIMSLNISPETKVAKVENWDLHKKMEGELTELKIKSFSGDEITLTSDKFDSFIENNNLSVSAVGVLYSQEKDGLLKSILAKWYSDRVVYQKKMKECAQSGDSAGKDFYNLRQGVLKILLNSTYGVLGLPSFRFHDLDNAESVTLSGQEIIKSSSKYANMIYNKSMETENVDYVVYCDTDSEYISAKPLMDKNGIDSNNFDVAKKFTIDMCSEYASKTNKFYDTLMLKFFNCKKHRIKIAEDSIARRCFWLAKKRYVMTKVYDMGKLIDINFDLEAKGIDIVRSSFPIGFKICMEDILKSILNADGKKIVDSKIINFINNIQNISTINIAKNTSVKFTDKHGNNFDPPDRPLFKYYTGTTGQLKAALAYNDLLKYFKLDKKHEPIYDRSKIKWIYLKKNPFNIDGLALKFDGTDPKQIVDFCEQYIDKNLLFEKELNTKILKFYEAMNWDIYSEHAEKAGEFFNFDGDDSTEVDTEKKKISVKVESKPQSKFFDFD